MKKVRLTKEQRDAKKVFANNLSKEFNSLNQVIKFAKGDGLPMLKEYLKEFAPNLIVDDITTKNIGANIPEHLKYVRVKQTDGTFLRTNELKRTISWNVFTTAILNLNAKLHG